MRYVIRVSDRLLNLLAQALLAQARQEGTLGERSREWSSEGKLTNCFADSWTHALLLEYHTPVEQDREYQQTFVLAEFREDDLARLLKLAADLNPVDSVPLMPVFPALTSLQSNDTP